jgi:hypothetical protein
VIFARGAVIARYPIAEAHRHAFAQNAITAALMTGVYDPVTMSEAYPQMDMLLKTVPYMKANRLSVFSGDVGSELGKPLESVFPSVSPDNCTGSLESVVRIDDPNGRGQRILGWAWDRKHQQPPSTIVVATKGIITGLGAVGKWRPDIRAGDPELSSSYVGFVAFVPETQPDSDVRLYAILHDTPPSACYLPMK